MIKFLKYIYLTSIILLSCDKGLTDVPIPVFGNESLLTNSIELNEFIKNRISGIYVSNTSTEEFGNKFVMKFNGNKLSVFTGRNSAYMILDGGITEDGIVFEGYWRIATGSETGNIRLLINKDNGADSLINGILPANIYVVCYMTNEKTGGKKSFIISFNKSLPEKEFWIIGHRGGGRNSDRLPASENSIEMIKLAESLGANSIEIDIKLTKDKIPVLFHDNNLSIRSINESYLIGDISNYTYPQLRTFCTLVRGGYIPTLNEALDSIINSTNLKLVWLDIKSPGLIGEVAMLQKKSLSYAKSVGREIEILIGIPSDEIFDEFVNTPNYENIPSICELSVDKTMRANSIIWAPRWSLGLQNEETEIIHSSGKRAFTWTLDESKFIRIYMKDAKFDGILTNFPVNVAYEFYTK